MWWIIFSMCVNLGKEKSNLSQLGKLFCWKPSAVWMSLCRGSIAKHRRANVAAEHTEERLSSEIPDKKWQSRERFWVRPNTFLRLTKFQTIRLVHTTSQSEISLTKATKQLANLSNTNKRNWNVLDSTYKDCYNVKHSIFRPSLKKLTWWQSEDS